MYCVKNVDFRVVTARGTYTLIYDWALEDKILNALNETSKANVTATTNFVNI
jgi:hypothetical protein